MDPSFSVVLSVVTCSDLLIIPNGAVCGSEAPEMVKLVLGNFRGYSGKKYF